MSAVPVPDRIAMCGGPEHDYWALKPGEEPGSCLHGECGCEPVMFVRESAVTERAAVERAAAALATHIAYTSWDEHSQEDRETFRRNAEAIVRAALDQGEGERP